ncbi:phosphate ABC transporter substrate-binding protein PstS [Streptomyces aidingensis]|uniref:Phosphate-binding protein n=1 Tax=Streptomyces aidingensis TaxID=910347 RepID=A0A1I1HN71_9ACTN|nr:phosphate ABC transporter substrate-binding protein PstS [Streptomyces aidingensis]SFC22893.1 phosphate transport system substrate-binding protein [Streptomyces aidingensis]
MKRTIPGRLLALPAAIVLSFGLAACSSSNESDDENNNSNGNGGGETAETTSELSGTLNGAGASSQDAAQQAWMAGFVAANPDVTVNYDPVGSGGGREQFVAGATHFGGTDAYLADEELQGAIDRCAPGELIELPAYISPIAVIFNLEGVDELNLSASTIAQIFDQKITNWNDEAIAADNPDVELPDQAITPVNRSDESGTTENFVEYLAAAAPEDWTHEVSGDWPVAGGEAAQGTSGVVQAVTNGEGTIGYADASQAGDLGTVKVKVGEEFVGYSPDAASKVVEVSTPAEGRTQYDFAYDLSRDTTESGAYPIVLLSYQMACTSYEDAETAELVKAYLNYMISPEGQQAAADAAGSAPISDSLRAQIQPAVDAISAAE